MYTPILQILAGSVSDDTFGKTPTTPLIPGRRVKNAWALGWQHCSPRILRNRSCRWRNADRCRLIDRPINSTVRPAPLIYRAVSETTANDICCCSPLVWRISGRLFMYMYIRSLLRILAVCLTTLPAARTEHRQIVWWLMYNNEMEKMWKGAMAHSSICLGEGGTNEIHRAAGLLRMKPVCSV